MADEPITHEQIEASFKPAETMIARLPDSIESREAKRLVECSESLAHQAREQAVRAE